MSDDAPQPDRLAGAPHPRDTPRLIGQDAAEAAFLDAFNSGKLHHAWMLTGPRGVGKATLAWRIARFLLATPNDDGGMFAAPTPDTLDIAPDHPVARRIAANGEGALRSVTRSVNPDTKKMRKQIVVDDIRALNGFFQMSAADGGRRVVIIDDADEMNPNAANALLKMLEEPPERAVLLLLSHQPSGLLPTIRSRCRVLRLHPLDTTEMQAALAASGVEMQGDPAALAALSGGSVGGALRLSLMGGLQIYAELVALMSSLPRMDRARVIKLAEAAAQRGAEEKLILLFALVDLLLARLARTGATGVVPQAEATPGEAELLLRLSPTPFQGRKWADLAQEVSARVQHGMAVNLDPTALVLDTLQKISDCAPR
ncbi:DNA polymerase III subunit delta' [Sulfitobacter sp. M57]|uniref:DNA polymerase III subunit delta' n=1 Tax=unclassified Sulfitobacter TaxID=196795 RepID=UPI0023E2BB5A|nr:MULTISPECIES: DNA polymerase III subunit delta' [unclassified Sulfitobacter]MDF3413070.1 DNA polymerase III subunit delta' [Sulfitobacter sp. KE5]MDF3421646.1 DNA polymerase III subunit delta' [Sulfitobacter sp. KE43]MDF3431619.1 DNA polymerase III subunit delta' [Sulfitobacter sp. KE42]MDF3457260.1 DNA polymerase III subunit delta' [Sulfitobacter sp. S74]MDF3461163.1 DNA polymerase III subunit delta' [Sulfitobacter sp. Ks18]